MIAQPEIAISGGFVALRASLFHGPHFSLFPSEQDGLAAPGIDVGQGEIFRALVPLGVASNTCQPADIAGGCSSRRTRRSALRDHLDFLTGPDQVSRVLEFDGKFAGLVSLSTQVTFWVARRYWRLGLASSALKWAVQRHLSCCSSRPMLTEVHSANQSSIRLLVKLGFEKTG